MPMHGVLRVKVDRRATGSKHGNSLLKCAQVQPQLLSIGHLLPLLVPVVLATSIWGFVGLNTLRLGLGMSTSTITKLRLPEQVGPRATRGELTASLEGSILVFTRRLERVCMLGNEQQDRAARALGEPGRKQLESLHLQFSRALSEKSWRTYLLQKVLECYIDTEMRFHFSARSVRIFFISSPSSGRAICDVTGQGRSITAAVSC